MRRMRSGLFLLVAMLALLTAGCGLNEKSAENYVKELLDYSTGRQTSTKIFDAEIKEEFRTGINEALEELTDTYLEEGEELSSELKTRLADATIEALKNVRYTVG